MMLYLGSMAFGLSFSVVVAFFVVYSRFSSMGWGDWLTILVLNPTIVVGLLLMLSGCIPKSWHLGFETWLMSRKALTSSFFIIVIGLGVMSAVLLYLY